MIRRHVAFALLLLAAIPFAGHRAGAQTAPRIVEITAKKYEFSPAEITLKRGEPVVLRLSSLDRVHGFMQKDLEIDAEINPAHPTEISLTPTTSGRFLTICDDYCGFGHANMKMVIVVAD